MEGMCSSMEDCRDSLGANSSSVAKVCCSCHGGAWGMYYLTRGCNGGTCLYTA